MEKIKVMLISGKVTSEHYYPKANEAIRTMLESTGRFEVRVVEEFNGATERTLEGYDLIFLNYDGKSIPVDEYERWEPGAEKVFFDFVKNGGGLYIHHSSIWLEDDMPQEYKDLWGYYVTMPEGRRAPEDDLIVKNVAPEDPIMKGIEDFMIVVDDLFAGVKEAPGEKEVLGAIYDDIHMYEKDWWPPKHHPVHIPDGKLENLPGINTLQPVIWKHHYGKGRVFGCSIGHGIDTYRRLNYVTILVRGAEWAATGEVTLEKPKRTGADRFNEWPYYHNN